MVLPGPTETVILVVLLACFITALAVRGPKLRGLVAVICIAALIGLMIYDANLRTPMNILKLIVAAISILLLQLVWQPGKKPSQKPPQKNSQANELPVDSWLPDHKGKKYFFEAEGDARVLAEKILSDKDLPELKSIVVGQWGDCYDNSPDPVLDMMIENREKFRHIESLFIGDMEYEECELSWINQSGRYKDLLRALPNLRSLTIKGSEGLSPGASPDEDSRGISPALEHNSLEELEIICGGLPQRIAVELQQARLPQLRKLILYMGVPDYGLTCTLDDLTPLAQKELFPNLKELGLVNSEHQDDITEMLLNSSILPQLEVLNISYGCLTDRGGRMILDARDRLRGLKKLTADYHFLSENMMKELQALPFEVSVADRQEADNDDSSMYPMFTE